MLTRLVWPDAEGDDAKTSFDSNLYRLRKLLDIDGALQLAEGKLSLNPDLVWLDVWAFEAALDAGDVDAALALYRGHFLALDAPLPWTLPARDRLQAQARARRARRGRGPRSAPASGRARGRCTSATLEVDNLAEAIYRRLMVCLREEGDPVRRADRLPALPRAAVDRARPHAVAGDRSRPAVAVTPKWGQTPFQGLALVLELSAGSRGMLWSRRALATRQNKVILFQ